MLGLLGGTFDPIHVAHLRLAIEVRERVNLDEVRLIPAPRPRLRDTPQVDAQTRLRLLRAAVHGIQGLAVDDCELASKGPTRTVQTLHSIRQDEGSRPLCLILGADAAAQLQRHYIGNKMLSGGLATRSLPGWSCGGAILTAPVALASTTPTH